ncbi:MAG: GtrA family protein [Pseudomonadota bacterium]
MVAVDRTTLTRLIRFGLVGGTGFVVDAGLTIGLQSAGLDIFSSRLIAIALAMLVTWRLNRSLTFGASTTSQVSEGWRYICIAVLAAAINYAVYIALMLTIPWMFTLLAVALATGVSMVVSYLGYNHWVFK